MAFWSEPSTEPTRQHLFILEIAGIPKWICKKVERPSFETSETELQYLNHNFYLPGRLKWNPIKMTLVNPITPDAEALMMDYMQAAGYVFPENADVTKTISKAEAVGALGNVYIRTLASNPASATEDRIVETWKLVNAWIKDASFGENTYEDEGVLPIEVTIRFDYAVQYVGDHE